MMTDFYSLSLWMLFLFLNLTLRSGVASCTLEPEITRERMICISADNSNLDALDVTDFTCYPQSGKTTYPGLYRVLAEGWSPINADLSMSLGLREPVFFGLDREAHSRVIILFEKN